MPAWLFWTFVIGGILAASILAYRDLYLDFEKVNRNVTKYEWEYRRKSLSKQRRATGLKKLPKLLNEMRGGITELVFSQTEADIAKKRDLMDIIPYASTESRITALKLANEGRFCDEQQLFFLELNNAMEETGFGISRLKKNSEKWNTLEKKLYNLRPDYLIDAELAGYVKDFNIVLDGLANWELHNIYIGEIKELGEEFTKKAKRKHIGGITGREYLLTLAYSKITKRVNELLNGDEAK